MSKPIWYLNDDGKLATDWTLLRFLLRNNRGEVECAVEDIIEAIRRERVKHKAAEEQP